MTAYLAFLHHERGGFSVVFPDLPGCTAEGDDFEQAMANGAEALALYVAALTETGQTIPAARSLRQIEAARLDWIEPGYTVAAIPLIAGRRESARINVMLDTDQLAAIDMAARRAGVDRSAFMVRASLVAAAPAMRAGKPGKAAGRKRA